MDELVNIPKVNAPEDESLEFANEIDRYRQYAGPANLAGKRVISNELGADIYKAFQQTLPELLDIFKRAIAGGVNQAVIHGSPYSGNYPNTTWPGMMTFGYQFAECHSRHQPAWDDYSQFMDNMARHQYIFQSGIPRRDVLFWEKRFWFPGNTSYADSDLVDYGMLQSCRTIAPRFTDLLSSSRFLLRIPKSRKLRTPSSRGGQWRICTDSASVQGFGGSNLRLLDTSRGKEAGRVCTCRSAYCLSRWCSDTLVELSQLHR